MIRARRSSCLVVVALATTVTSCRYRPREDDTCSLGNSSSAATVGTDGTAYATGTFTGRTEFPGPGGSRQCHDDTKEGGGVWLGALDERGGMSSFWVIAEGAFLIQGASQLPSGAFAVVGENEDTVTLGRGTPTETTLRPVPGSPGTRSEVMAVYDRPGGSLRWARTMSSFASIVGFVPGDDGSIYVAVSVWMPTTIAPGDPLQLVTAPAEAYGNLTLILRYLPDGTLDWILPVECMVAALLPCTGDCFRALVWPAESCGLPGVNVTTALTLGVATITSDRSTATLASMVVGAFYFTDAARLPDGDWVVSGIPEDRTLVFGATGSSLALSFAERPVVAPSGRVPGEVAVARLSGDGTEVRWARSIIQAEGVDNPSLLPLAEGGLVVHALVEGKVTVSDVSTKGDFAFARSAFVHVGDDGVVAAAELNGYGNPGMMLSGWSAEPRGGMFLLGSIFPAGCGTDGFSPADEAGDLGVPWFDAPVQEASSVAFVSVGPDRRVRWRTRTDSNPCNRTTWERQPFPWQ